MKRCLWLLLLAVLLVGCAENVEPDSIPTTAIQETTLPPETSCYVQQSELEKDSNGAVKVYDLPDQTYSWMRNNGDALLLHSASEDGKYVEATGEGTGFFLNEQVFPELKGDPAPQTTTAGIAFYTDTQAVFLRPGLQQFSVEHSDLAGQPVFSADGNSLFYCEGNEIWALDLNTGIKRMLKSHTSKEQTLTGLYFDGTVIGCRILQEDGTETLAFISVETGRTIAQETNISNVQTFGERYIVDYLDGTIPMQIFGKGEETPQCLWLPDSDETVAVLEWNSVLAYSAVEGETRQYDLYSLETGMCYASVEMQGTPKSICASKSGQSLWILVTDPENGEDVLYQWLTDRSPVSHNFSCVSPYYTAENPDVEGLNHYKEITQQMGKTHSVEVLIWDDAVKNPGDYELVGEYQTIAIANAIAELEKVLVQYPQDFLYKLPNQSLKICLVRSISTGADSVQYLYDGDFYIALSVGCDYSTAFAEALGYLVDIHVLGNTSAFDDWASLNPEGFVYGQELDEALLSGDTRAFADEACMASVTDDRSRTFFYAMCPGNEEMFASEIMQSKLSKLCQGIRAAWRWKNAEEVFPWEQYLNVSQ